MHNCQNCDAFRPSFGDAGECKANPPEIRDGWGRWPMTTQGEWCRAWAPLVNTATQVEVSKPNTI